VFRASLAGLAAAFISGLFTGIASGMSAHWWLSPPPWAVYMIVVLSMLIPEAALIASVTPAIAAVSPEIVQGNPESGPAWFNFLNLLGLGHLAENLLRRRRAAPGSSATAPRELPEP
jgi:hypothetical protein